MRIGKFVEHFKAAARAADSKSMEPIMRYLAVGRQLGYAFYLFCDTLTYPDAAGIRKYEGATRMQQRAYRFWLAGLTCNIVSCIYTLFQQQKQLREHEESADAEKAVSIKKVTGYASNNNCNICFIDANLIRSDRRATMIQLLSDVSDACIPVGQLQLLPLDDGFIGLAGTCSSLIGLEAQWEKTSPTSS